MPESFLLQLEFLRKSHSECELLQSDLNYLLRGMYPKGEPTAMLVREPAPLYELSAGLSKKSRKICSEVMTKIIEVLEENKI